MMDRRLFKLGEEINKSLKRIANFLEIIANKIDFIVKEKLIEIQKSPHNL